MNILNSEAQRALVTGTNGHEKTLGVELINNKYNKKIKNNIFDDRYRAQFKCGHRCKLDVLTGDFHVPCGCVYYKSMRSNSFGYEFNVYRRRMEEMVKYSEEQFNRHQFFSELRDGFLVAGMTLESFPKYLCYDMRECLPYSVGMNFQAYTLLKQFDLYEAYTSRVVAVNGKVNDRECNRLFFEEVRDAYYRRREDLLFYSADHQGDGCSCPVHFFKALFLFELYVAIGVPFNTLGRNHDSTIPVVDRFEYYEEIVSTGGFQSMVKRLFEVDLLAHYYSSDWITSELSKIETFMLANFFPSFTTDGIPGAIGQIGFRFRELEQDLVYNIVTTSLPVVFGHYLHTTFQGVVAPPKPITVNTVIEGCYICDSVLCDGSCIWRFESEVNCEGPESKPSVNFELLDEESDSSDEEDDEVHGFGNRDIRVYDKVKRLEFLKLSSEHNTFFSQTEYKTAMRLMDELEFDPPTMLNDEIARAHGKMEYIAQFGIDEDTLSEVESDVEGALADNEEFDAYDDAVTLSDLEMENLEYNSVDAYNFERAYENMFNDDFYPDEAEREDFNVHEEGRSRVEFNKKKVEAEFRQFVKRMPRSDYQLVFQMYKKDKKRIYTALPDARRIDMQNFLDWLHLHSYDKVKCESNLTNLLKTFGLEGSEFTIYGMTIFSAFYQKQWTFLFYEFMTNDYWTVADEHIRNVVIFLQNCFLGTSESLSEEFMNAVIIPILVSVGITLEDFAYDIARLVGFCPEVMCESPMRENLLMEAFLRMVTVVSMSNYLKDLAPVEYLVSFVNKVKVFRTDAYEPIKVSFDFFKAFGECCVECYQERSFMPLLRWDNMQAFTDDHIEWVNSVKLSIKPTIAWFEDKKSEGEELEKRCKKLMKKGSMSTLEYTKFSQALSIALYQLENRRKACEMAPQAFGVILRGPPGGGKTALGEGLHKMVAAINCIDPSISLGQIKIDSKHQTNVLNHVVSLLFNDVDLAPKGDPQSWIATCEALRAGVDTAPFQTEQASLEDKENAFVKPQLTMVTTNSDMWYFGEISGEKFARRYPLVAFIDKKDNMKEVSLDNMKVVLETLVVTGDGLKNKPCVGRFVKTGVVLNGEEFLEYFRSNFTRHHLYEKQNISKRNLAYQFCKFGLSLNSHLRDDVKIKCCTECNILDKDELEKFGRDKALEIINATTCSKYCNPGSVCSGFECHHCTLKLSLDTKCGANKYLLDHYMPCDNAKCELNWSESSYCVYDKHAFDHTEFCGEYCHIYRPGLVCDCGMAWKVHTQQCSTALFACRYNPIRVKALEPFKCNQGLLIKEQHTSIKCCGRCNFLVIEDLLTTVTTEGPKEDVEAFFENLGEVFSACVSRVKPETERERASKLRGAALYNHPNVVIDPYRVWFCEDGKEYLLFHHTDQYNVAQLRDSPIHHILNCDGVETFGTLITWRSAETGMTYPIVRDIQVWDVVPEGPREVLQGVLERTQALYRQRSASYGLEIESDEEEQQPKKCCAFNQYWWKHAFNAVVNVFGMTFVGISYVLHIFLNKTIDRVVKAVIPNKIAAFFSTPQGVFLLRLGQGAIAGVLVASIINKFRGSSPKTIFEVEKLPQGHMGCKECDEKCDSIRAQHLSKLNPSNVEPVTEALRYADNPERFLVYGVPQPDQIREINGVEYDKGVLNQPLLINNPRLATSVFEDVLNVLRASCLEIHCDGIELTGWVYNQSLIIFNTHFLPHFQRSKIVAINVKKARKLVYYEFNMDDVSIHQDLTFLKLTGLGNGIEPFLYPTFVNQKCSGRLVDTEFSFLPVVVRPDYRTQVAGMYAPTTFYGYVAPSEPGWCGRILLLEIGSKWGIAGIHSHGADHVPKVGLSTAIYPSLAPHVLFKSVEVAIDEKIQTEGVLNVRSPLALFPDAVPLGTFNNAMVEQPKITKSDLYDLGQSMLPPGVVYDFPKKRDSGIVNGVWKHGVKKKALGVSAVSFHSTDLANKIIDYTVGQINETAQPLTPGVALVGLEGMTKGMNPKTSNGPGFYHVKNKNQLIDDKGQVVEWFQFELICRLMGYDKGTIKAWETVFQRKAEVLPLEKIAEFATRIFTVGGLDLNVLGKMFMGPLSDIVLKHFDVFRCAGKINATSKQWHFLHEQVMKHVYKLFADESGFDAKHKAAIFHVVAEWMRKLALKVGYSEKASDIVYMICINALHQVVQYKGDFIYIDYMLGSGFFLTLLLNSLVHLYLLWVAYAFIVTRDIIRFFSEVAIALVGDDMAGSTSNPDFNLLAIAKVLKDLCGYTITSSIKGRELTAFSAPEEESFLKRTWRYDMELNMYMGALYFGSVIKPIMFYEYNSEVSQAEKLAQTLNGLQRECFFHGREIFEKYARDERIVAEYEKYGVIQFTYDELKDKFLEDNEYFASWDQTLRIDGRETLNRCTQSVSPPVLVTERSDLQPSLTLAGGYAISEEGPKAAPLHCDNALTEIYTSGDNTTMTDEIIATTAFETSLQTLSSAPAPPIKSGQFGDEYYQKILEKPVYIGTSSISNVVDSFEIADIFNSWMTHATISPLITRYARFRGCPKVTLVCNGSTYFFGKALLGVDHKIKNAPNFAEQSFGGSLYSVHQLCQLPHLDVDYSKSESYSIKVPWMSPNPFINTVGPTSSQNYVVHHLYLMGINTLACIDATVVAPSMTFAVYISMEDIEFSIITAEGPDELKKDGLISAPLKSVSNLIKSVPSLPPNFTPYTDIADGLADVLSKVGLGKAPMLDVQPTTLISNPHFMNEDGRGAMHILANQTKQAKTLNVPAFADEDDMLIEKICSKWFFFKKMEPTSAMSVGTQVGHLKLGPSCTPSYSTNVYYPGPVNLVASMFDAWRGDFEVKIEIMGTTFHRGILSFTVDSSSGPTYSNALNKSRVYTLDISQERELIIQVPYRHQEPYLSLTNHDAFDSESELAPYITHAVVNCWITSPVSVGLGTGVQKVYVNYYVRTKNNDFQRPTMTKYQIGYGIRFEGPVYEEGPEPFVGSSTVALNNKIFGEKYSSLKQLSSMLCPYGFIVDTPSETKIAARRHPFVPLPPQFSTLHENYYPAAYWWEPGDDLGFVNGTYTTIIATAFFGQKGGYRYAIDNRFIHNGTNNMYHQAVRNVDIELLWGANAATSGYISTVSNIFTSTMFPNYDKVIADNEGGLSSFLVPDYHECEFRPANVLALDYTVAANADPNFNKYMAWSYKYPVLGGNDNMITVYVAAADDNVCFSWRFVPRVLYND